MIDVSISEALTKSSPLDTYIFMAFFNYIVQLNGPIKESELGISFFLRVGLFSYFCFQKFPQNLEHHLF